MIEFEQACELIFENANHLGSEERLIENSVGYALAADIASTIDVTPFRNSAMDGFAVKAEWLADCSKDKPLSFPLGATVFAGDSNSTGISDERVIKVMTGACVPDGFDTVVPFEHTEYNDSEVRFFEPVTAGRHVRLPGEDVARGQKLFSKGDMLGRLDIGILASIGLHSVEVYKKPSVLIVGTGDEIVEPGKKLDGGQVYDSNTFTISSLLSPLCEKIERICQVCDREEDIRNAIDSSHDVIVTSGGVSAGERDLIIGIAESCGWKRVFHKVKIKPGKPVYFAMRGKQILFGLPGNPLSAAVTCAIFTMPALKKIIGMKDYQLQTESAQLKPGTMRKTGRKFFWPGFFVNESGKTVAEYSVKKSSAALTAIMNTDGLIIQEVSESCAENNNIKIIHWDRSLFP